MLRRMGYMLAKPCRKCGCGIAVPSRDEKDEKDVAGVDEHAYAKVCERAKARSLKSRAGTEQQSSAAAQQSSAAARQSSRRAEQQSRPGLVE